MSKVYTANVYITKSRAAIDRVFFGASQLTSLTERLLLLSDDEVAQSFIYSPNKNDGLLRFEYSYGNPGKHFVKCQFAETSKLLELLLVGNDPMARLLESKVDQLGGELQRAVDLFDDNKTKDTVKREATLESKLERLSRSGTYYFAFGVGDDLSKWSGPHVMTLFNAVLTNDENNVRMVEAFFAPNPGSHKLWSKTFTEDFGYAGIVDKFNEMLSKETFIRASSKEFVSKDAPDVDSPSLNIRLRSLAKKYLQSVTSNGNVVVVIPNDLAKETKADEAPKPKPAPTPPLDVNNMSFEEYADNIKDSYAQAVSDKETKLEATLKVLGVKKTDIRTDEITGPTGQGFSDIKLKSSLPRGTISPEIAGPGGSPLLSPAIGSNTLPRSLIPSLPSLEEIEARNKAFLAKKKSVLQPDVVGEKGLSNLPLEGYNLEMGVTIPVSEDAGTNEPEPLLAPIYKFAAGIKELDTKYFSQEFTFFEETDVRILKLWKRFGIISVDTKPALVFGDKDEIKNLLYIDSGTEDVKLKSLEQSTSLLFDVRNPGESAFDSRRSVKSVNENKLRYNDYKKEFVEIFKKTARSSSFEENIEELDKGLETVVGGALEAKGLLGSSDMVLRHNMSNPNVRSLLYSTEAYYAALVGLDVYPNLSKQFVNSTALPIVRDIAFDVLGKNFITNLIKKIDDTLTDPTDDLAFSIQLANDSSINEILFQISERVAQESNSTVTGKVGDLALVDLVSFISFVRYLDRLRPDDNGIKILTSPQRYETVYTSMYNRMKTLMVKVELKTLPFFNRNVYMSKTVSLVGMNNAPMGVHSKRTLAPYTGQYQIVGHSHVIEQEDIYSTFNLVRIGAESKQEITDINVKDAVFDFLSAEKVRLLGSIGFDESGEWFIPVDRFLVWATGYSSYGKDNYDATNTRLSQVNDMLERLQ